MSFDLCIPALNEESIIGTTIAALKKQLDTDGIDVRITVVDNGSTDSTVQKAKAAGAETLRIEKRGKGAAVIAAASASGADIFGFIDADLSAEPSDIRNLYARVQSGECDVAIGSRLMDTSIVERGNLRTLSSKLFNLMRRATIGVGAEDTQCGLKIMNGRGKALLSACTETGWFFDMEFLARCERAGLRITEVPIHWVEQRYPGRESRLRMLRDGFGAIVAMFRIRKRVRSQIS